MKNKKNLIIVSMMVIVAVMAIGYSFFATRLNINATGNITSNWNVYFANITSGTIVGSASNASTPSVSGTTANMEANLQLPGDSITYELTLTNGGTIGAIIEDIEAKSEGSSAIIYSISGLKIGDKLAGGQSIVITIKIEYDPNATSQPSETSKSLTVSIDTVQDIGQYIESIVPSVDQPMKLSTAILRSNDVQNDSNINFKDPSSDTNGKGLYSTTDNDGATYYFRGNVESNYVKIGTGAPTITQTETVTKNVYYWCSLDGETWEMSCDRNTEHYYNTEEECNNDNPNYYCEANGTKNIEVTTEIDNPDAATYWRIVRINGDGTIRLVYDGTKAVKNGVSHILNIETAGVDHDDLSHVVSWYNNNMKEKYNSLFTTGKFCSDGRMTELGDSNCSDDVNCEFIGWDRLNAGTPTLNCPSSTTSIAGYLSLDEVMMAGLSKSQTINLNNYLYTSDTEFYWTSTPSGIYSSTNSFTYGNNIEHHSAESNYDSVKIRPVVNLRDNIEVISGTGTINDPYIIKTN